MKKTPFIIFGGLLAASIGLMAQSAPDATIDGEGRLILNPGTDEERTILPPAGSVDANGNLVIDGSTFSRPMARVNASGALEILDGEGNVTATLEVPELPSSNIPLQDFFTSQTWPGTAPFYFSPILNWFVPGDAPWMFWEDWGLVDELSGWFAVDTQWTEEGFWAYSHHFEAWCYFFVGDGTNGFRTGLGRDSPADHIQTGSFVVDGPNHGGDIWHFFDQEVDESAPAGRRAGYFFTDADGNVDYFRTR
ncbi:MAG: hypothetical protein JJT96_15485 [Opitutales bacterium]|nr:hypothetical protein [Opitutales bacterium]